MKFPRLLRRPNIEAAAGLEIVLRPNRLLRLAAARGRHLLCTAGCAWITAPGMPDIFLHSGEAWEVDTNGLVLLEAVGNATIAIGDQAMSPST